MMREIALMRKRRRVVRRRGRDARGRRGGRRRCVRVRCEGARLRLLLVELEENLSALDDTRLVLDTLAHYARSELACSHRRRRRRRRCGACYLLTAARRLTRVAVGARLRRMGRADEAGTARLLEVEGRRDYVRVAVRLAQVQVAHLHVGAGADEATAAARVASTAGHGRVGGGAGHHAAYVVWRHLALAERRHRLNAPEDELRLDHAARRTSVANWCSFYWKNKNSIQKKYTKNCFVLLKIYGNI